MLSLRPARLDDPDALLMIAEVQRWYVEIYGGEDTDPLDPDAFAPPHGGFVIGSDAARPVAMGGWSRRDDPALDRATASVRRMFVREDARRHGYADQVLHWIEADAHAAGIQRLTLTTGSPQVAAVAFYRARSFVDTQPYGYWAEHGFNAVFLAKDLDVR